MLERLVETMKAKPGVAFMRLDEYARRWRESHPLDERLAGKPVHARETSADGVSRPRSSRSP